MVELTARAAPNWTTAAGAAEGILHYLDAPLPRYAVMGLTALAWHFRLGEAEGIAALPSGPVEIDWETMAGRFERLGLRWERFSGGSDVRDDAIAWARSHLDAGRPLIGWDFHLHEHAVVFGYDAGRGGYLVDDNLTPQVGAFAAWDMWPSRATGRIELLAPGDPVEVDAAEAVLASLDDALSDLGADDGPSGTSGLERWADAFEGDGEVDRVGNAYTLQVLQAARMDGADYLANLAEVFPDLATSLGAAERAVRDELQALAPLITLFPFPTGGHGNVANPGMREAAATALRKAAAHERRATEAIAAARDALREILAG